MIKNEFQTKRRTINTVGNVQKILFGTMDNTDSEDTYEKLAELKHKDRDTIHALEHQNTFLENNCKIMFKPIK